MESKAYHVSFLYVNKYNKFQKNYCVNLLTDI